MVDDPLVEILTTKVGVTGGRQDLEDALVDRQERHIKGTTTKIVDNDVSLTVILVQAVSNSSGGGLVNDTQDVQAGNDTGVLGSLSLVVVEVGRDGNDGMGDLLAEVGLGDFLHLAENDGRYLLGGELLGLALNVDLNNGLAILLDDLVGEVLEIVLDLLLAPLAADKSPIEKR